GGDGTFVAFGGGGKTLLPAGRGGTIPPWGLPGGKELRPFAPPQPGAPAPGEDGGKPGGGGKNAESGPLGVHARSAKGPGDSRVARSPDGKPLAAGTGNVIQLWEVETGKELRQIQAPSAGLVSLLFSPDGRALAGRAPNGGLFLWETETGKELHQIKPPPRPGGNEITLTFGGSGGDAPGMDFTPDGKALAAAVPEPAKDGTASAVQSWGPATGK